MSVLVMAHAGHWLTSVAFFGPVLILPLGLYVAAVVGRHHAEDGGDADDRPRSSERA